VTRLRLYSGAALLLVAAMLAGCSAATGPDGGTVPIEEPGPLEGPSKEESRLIAERFVRDSATFVFDGIADSLRETAALDISQPHAWTFVFEFDSRHAGYGDRSDQMLAQVITPHEASITVDKGEVVYATLDSAWDTLAQTELFDQIDPDDAVAGPAADFTGFITEIQAFSHGSALGLIMAESHADKIVDKYAITILGETEILELNGEPAGFEALEVTQQVQVWFSGPVKESFPMQVDAGKVIISRTR
jgi:hypothetical protein